MIDTVTKPKTKVKTKTERPRLPRSSSSRRYTPASSFHRC